MLRSPTALGSPRMLAKVFFKARRIDPVRLVAGLEGAVKG
jgi:hypothetical protein